MGHRENAPAAMLAGNFPIMASARGYSADDGEADFRIKQIRDQQESALGRSEHLLASVAREGRDLTAAEKQQIDDNATYVERLDAERVKLLDTFTPGTPQARRTAPDQLPGDRYAGGGSPFAHTNDARFSAMFPERAQQRGGFANLGEFGAAVLRRDPKLFNAVAGMSEGTGADGGFAVPGQFESSIMDNSLAAEVIRPNAYTINATSNPITIPIWDSTDRTLGVAGLQPLAAPEGGVMVKEKPILTQLTLSLKKQYLFIPATNELLEDAPAEFARMLERHMKLAMSQKLDELFLWGNGAGVPLGIMNAPALIVVAAEGSQIADTITAGNLAAMSARLAPGSWKTAKWLVSPSAAGQLLTATQTVKNLAGSENVGGFSPSWLSVDGMGNMSILGRQVIVTDQLSALGDLGDILLADLSSYVVAVSAGGMKLARSDHFYFDTDQVAFRLTMRVDGQPLQSSAITPRRGSATLSPFITLAAR